MSDAEIRRAVRRELAAMRAVMAVLLSVPAAHREAVLRAARIIAQVGR